MNVPRVFLDADVLFAGSARPTEFGASHVLLRMGQFTLLECFASEQAFAEAERNLMMKAPGTVPLFHALVRQCVHVVPDPNPDELAHYSRLADPKDVPILAAAVSQKCRWLLTFNVRHYWPPTGLILVQRPGTFLAAVRARLAQLDDAPS